MVLNTFTAASIAEHNLLIVVVAIIVVVASCQRLYKIALSLDGVNFDFVLSILVSVNLSLSYKFVFIL